MRLHLPDWAIVWEGETRDWSHDFQRQEGRMEDLGMGGGEAHAIAGNSGILHNFGNKE